jgi:hypothetical protein
MSRRRLAAVTVLTVALHGAHQVTLVPNRRKEHTEQESPMHPHATGLTMQLTAKTADDPADGEYFNVW